MARHESIDLHNMLIINFVALKDQKEKNGALLSSLFTAAHRKVMRKPSRPHHQENTTREEPTTPTHHKSFTPFPAASNDIVQVRQDIPFHVDFVCT